MSIKLPYFQSEAFKRGHSQYWKLYSYEISQRISSYQRFDCIVQYLYDTLEVYCQTVIKHIETKRHMYETITQ